MASTKAVNAMSEKLDGLSHTLNAFQEEIAVIKQQVLGELENFRQEIRVYGGRIQALEDRQVTEDVVEKFNSIESSGLLEVCADNPGLGGRIRELDAEDVVNRMVALEGMNVRLEQRVNDLEKRNARKRPFLYDRTIVCSKVPVMDDVDGIEQPDDCLRAARRVVVNGLGMPEDTKIVASMRLPKPQDATFLAGLKIEFEDEDTKITALKAKSNLKNKEGFTDIYIRSSQSHFERAMIKNFNVFLNVMELPYFVANNGMVFAQDGGKVDMHGQAVKDRRPRMQDRGQATMRGAGRGRGSYRAGFTQGAMGRGFNNNI
jgi:hypothetical protein